jgi:hypothetical protein
MGNQGKSEKQIISFEFYTHVVSFSLWRIFGSSNIWEK